MVQMDKESVKKAIKQLKESSKKRNFTQSFDLIINLKGLNLKKPDNQVELFIQLPHSKGKQAKICAFVGPELKDQAKDIFDTTIFVTDFEKYQDQKLAKKLANDHDFFIAQANIMPKVAQTFGKILGTRGKMPNPKAGCVVPPKATLKPLFEKLKKTIKAKAKIEPVVKVTVGDFNQSEDEITDNILTIIKAVIHKLPGESNNIKNTLLKLSMSKPIKLE